MSFKNNNITINLGNKNKNGVRYKQIITIAYPSNNEGTLVMHFNIIDESPAQYERDDLVNMYLSNDIPGQEIWGTYYKKMDFVLPVFYCKKPLGETKMLLKCQSAEIEAPIFELNSWDVTGVGRSVLSYTSNVIKIND